jgi:hypothetical protein
MADIVERLRKHVNDRGGSSIANGAWEMMLEAASEIEHLRLEHQHACQEIGVAVQERDDARVLVEGLKSALHEIVTNGEWCADCWAVERDVYEIAYNADLAVSSTKSTSADDTVALASPVCGGSDA